MALSGTVTLATLGLRHLPEVLFDVFLLDPHTAPDKMPQTLQDLASMSGLGVEEASHLLEEIVQLERDIEITPKDLQQLLQGSTSVFMLDVRQPWEYEICSLPDSHLMTQTTLMDQLPQLQQAELIVTICHHGVRSYSAAMYLRGEGLLQTKSLAGGVEQWALEIDPTLPRY